MLNLALVALALALTILVFFHRKFRYWDDRKVYSEKPSWPFGNAYDLITHRLSHAEEFQKWYEFYKMKKRLAYGGYYAFFKPIFIPADLDLIRDILSNDFEHFTDHVIRVNEKIEPITLNLITMKGSSWKRLRTKLTPSFTSLKMKGMFPIILECSSGLSGAFAREMKANGTTDVREIIARYTTDVVGTCIFGLDSNSLEDPEATFRKIGKTFFDVSTRGNSLVHLLSFLVPSLLSFFKIPLMHRKVKDTFSEIVKNNAEYRRKNSVERNDVFQQLLDLQRDGFLSLDQVIAQCFLFFVAGFETSSSTTTFCLYELAANINVQDKLREEIRKIFAKHEWTISYEALAEMTYMDQCIYETLRKYPSIPVHTRECTKTYRIPNSDVFLEKGTFVMISVLGIHRDPEIHPEPEVFDPERFSKEISAARHPCAWMPFGIGPRACIGERMGMLQIKTCLARLILNYKFTLNSRTENPLKFDGRSTTILVPKGDVLLDIEELKQEVL